MKDIARYEADEHVSEAKTLDSFLTAQQHLSPCQLARSFGEPIGSQSEYVHHADADQRSDHRCSDKNSDHSATDLAERCDLAHTYDSSNHHHEHQRHNNHAQQVHVT